MAGNFKIIQNGKPQGRGIIYFPDGSIFEGGFR